MSSLEALFCDIDDFCNCFEAQWESQLLGYGVKTRKRARNLYLSEIMTILVAFHQNHYRNFKHYYAVNILCGLIAYCHQPKKPSLHFEWALPQST